MQKSEVDLYKTLYIFGTLSAVVLLIGICCIGLSWKSVVRNFYLQWNRSRLEKGAKHKAEEEDEQDDEDLAFRKRRSVYEVDTYAVEDDSASITVF